MSIYIIVKTKNSLVDNERLYKIISASVQYSIPFNNENIDYKEYLKWVEDGNSPETLEV
jgi:hypothetical protein